MAWEASILLWIQNVLRSEGLDRIFSAFTRLGDKGMLFILIGIGLSCFPRTRKLGLTVLTALLIGALTTNLLLKPLIARPRPFLAIEGLTALVEAGDRHSFPSGHTTAAFAFTSVMIFSGKGRGWKLLSLSIAVLMAFSRLYVGVHYPTDVLGGMAVGILAGRLAWQVWKRDKTR